MNEYELVDVKPREIANVSATTSKFM